jgi:hypothetical protein
MVRSSTPVDVVAGTGPYGLSLAAHLRASCGERRILRFIGPAVANSVGPVRRFVDGTCHPVRHLAQHLSAVPARFKPAPRIQSLGCAVLP